MSTVLSFFAPFLLSLGRVMLLCLFPHPGPLVLLYGSWIFSPLCSSSMTVLRFDFNCWLCDLLSVSTTLLARLLSKLSGSVCVLVYHLISLILLDMCNDLLLLLPLGTGGPCLSHCYSGYCDCVKRFQSVTSFATLL